MKTQIFSSLLDQRYIFPFHLFQRRSLSPRNHEELSVLGSSCAASVLRANVSTRCAITPRNRLDKSRTPSRSAIEESSSDLQPSSEEAEEEEDAQEVMKGESKKYRMESVRNPSSNRYREVPTLGNVQVRDKLKPGLEIKIDDIPYVDERDDLDVTEDVFPSNDLGKIKESPARASTNARNKLERMASRASFIIESALWVQRLSSKASTGSDRLASSRSNSPETKDTIARTGSIFQSAGRLRNAETAPRMSNKDKKLLKMILVIFSSFLVCYLPITVTKTFKNAIDWRGLNIAGYILIYLTTCINPVVYVVMSSEYRSAYKNLLLCRNDAGVKSGAGKLFR